MHTTGRTVLLNLALGILLLGVVELVYSALAWLFIPPADLWIFEEVGRTIRFDPVRGYTLTRIPSRFARLIDGRIEYVGVFQGNAQGMPDRDDFSSEHPPQITRRYAVFGDSYTSAQYLATNWPERTEELLRAAGTTVELLNISTHGAGLANWVSNLEGILARDEYAVDGLLFAVFDDDLQRRFTLADGRDRERLSFGHVAGWDPATYPRTRAEAGELLERHEINTTYILDSDTFEAALAGDWRPERRWEFKVWNAALFHGTRLWQAVQRLLAARPRTAESRFDAGQLRLINTIREYAVSRDLPVWVVRVPGLDEATGKPGRWYAETREFARRLAAGFIDGRRAFAGLNPARLQDLWFVNDGHWNQAGSDLFAAFMAERLLHDVRPAGAGPGDPLIE